MVIEKLRSFLATPAGKAVSGIFVIVAVVIMFMMGRGTVSNDAVAMSRQMTLIDSQTKQVFQHTVTPGETFPPIAPSGGKGYPVEWCNWTADGHISPNPTPVLLNEYAGIKGPTFCPTCGRLVKMRNEPGSEGETPPPTKEEYSKRHG